MIKRKELYNKWKYGKVLNGYEDKYQISNLGRIRNLHFRNTNKIKLMSSHIVRWICSCEFK